MIRINDNWEFISEWSDSFFNDDFESEKIRIPHTVKELPLHYVDSDDYQMICGYRRKLFVEEGLKGKHLFLQFDACAHIATIYINKQEVFVHRCGYTAFRVEISDYVKYGEENDIHVKLDTTENPEVPPFGFVIDYLTFGGIYRSVYFDVKEEIYISEAYITTPEINTMELAIEYEGEVNNEELIIELYDANNELVFETKAPSDKNKIRIEVNSVKPWSINEPNLYTCKLKIKNDEKNIRFGFRKIRIDNNSCYLNDKKVFLREVSRHQSYPYIGYAATDSLQREDARILKEELHVNTVRTSHYPQSHAFIDACDEMGILVFTEIPGWQHVGDENWQQQAIENTKEMVKEYRQHPSIIIWGVRINESQDYDEFYTETNKAAKVLDKTRPTSGVRFIENSSLLEDIYGYNDFSHNGITAGVKKKKEVTKEDRPLLITECNGHMFPTKSYDISSRRQEHALRHARVLNDAMSDNEHMGFIAWCMFDYNTHKDFGSGDRICYHGVLDAFRNHKLAASVYASQDDSEPVLEIGSSMDIGDYDASNIGEVYAFTNADEVKLYKNDEYVNTFKGSKYRAMKHGPILIEDTIGELIKNNENYNEKQEKLIHECMLSAKKHGLANLPAKDKAKLAYLMLHHKIPFDEGVRLYNKYVGGWGEGSTTWRYDAIKNGEVVKTKIKSTSTKLHLDVKVSNNLLTESDTYDMALVRIRLLDEYDNVATYAQLPLTLKCAGEIEIVGPKLITLEGGMTGTIIKTNGKEGFGSLIIECGNIKEEVSFNIRRS